jgi:predicted nucleotidyltransferase component of viral defense system
VTEKPIRNIAASVSQRLTNLSRKKSEDFQLLLTRYCIERLLYRLSQSEHSEQFVLKGAMLFTLWSNQPYRPTRDLDLPGKSVSSAAQLRKVFQDVSKMKVEDDGVIFEPESVQAAPIREEQEYGGIRVELVARLAQARLRLQVDVGFGDALVPKPQEVDYPSILGFPQPRLLAYRRETMVAEKFQTMVVLGIANSRMRDFYDLWAFAVQFDFEGPPLSQAIKATFTRRKTTLPMETPLALTSQFHQDRNKQAQWNAFLRKGHLRGEGRALSDVAGLLVEFLMPPTVAVTSGQEFRKVWPAGGPWR